MTWRLELAAVGRTLRKLDPPIRRRIVAELSELEMDPFGPGTEKLHGSDDLYRRRVGDWRIVFAPDYPSRIVNVLRIAHRREVYRIH